jgi:3-deoxy-7-phosphoheptulonate synthase
MNRRIDDLRIETTRPLVSPAILLEEVDRTEAMTDFIADARDQVTKALFQNDPRLVVIVGPCSIHDPAAAREYAEKLKEAAHHFRDALLIVMRAYFEKPRTVVGWKGFLTDPDLDGSHRINRGLRDARLLLRDFAAMELPAATEFLDMTAPQYIADFISWGAIGARTTESQPHRELASGLSMPIGFKNPTDGRVQPAIDAVLAAREPHWFASNTKDGVAAHFRSTGNDHAHLVLRGGSKTGPNYDADHVAEAQNLLEKACLPPAIMIDASHANSGKDPNRQAIVIDSVVRQLRTGSSPIRGVMIESNLVSGRQDFDPAHPLTYGQSITDACLDFAQTLPLLENLALAR